jgi:hypothetical protein
MLLSISFVPVKQITSSVPRSNFSDDDLNRIAELILKGEGIINPLILRSTSLESYEVVDGHFEYYAAARAKEIDLRKGEMIGAFIIESNNQEVLEQQVQLLRASKAAISSVTPVSDSIESRLNNMESRSTNTESRLTNLESRLEKRLSEFHEDHKREIKNINNRLKEIENIIPKPIEALEALNILSLSELTSKLRRVNVNSKIIEKIVSERQKGNYTSFSNVVVRIKGLGDKTMLKIIDSFSEGINGS